MIALAAVLTAGVYRAAPAPRSTPHVVGDRTIPLTFPSDVRWLDDTRVLVTDTDRGIATIAISANDAGIQWLPDWPQPTGPGSRYFHLAVSSQYIVAGDFAFRLRWQARETAAHGTISCEFIADVDVHDKQILISGLRRDAAGSLGSDGATAWIGRIDSGGETLRPILPFRSRKAIEDCAGFGLGVVRFLGSGSFVVVPGSEPGVYLFGNDAKLQRVWQTDALDLSVNCNLSRDEQIVLAQKPVARAQWINRHAIVDDVLDTEAGPALIVRKLAAGTTRWEIVRLGGTLPSTEDLPVTSPSPWAHVRAAMRGRRAVLLIADRLPGRDDGAAPRLVVVEWSRR